MNAIALDAMGGDHAPGPEVSGAVAAVREAPIKVFLVGKENRLREELSTLGAANDGRIEVVNADDVVTMDDSPTQVFRQKPNSSMRIAFDLVKSGKAEAVVSAGNSGAMLAHGLFVLKRVKNVDRPGIVTVFPTPTGRLVLCDMGANVEAKPRALAQFGLLGAHYDRIVHGHARPRVGLLSNGTEESKGTDLTRAAHQVLVSASKHPEADFTYVGYVEGSEIFHGHIDVVATDGFTGNVVLKTAEGVSEAILRMIKRSLTSTLTAKLGAMLARRSLEGLRDSLHYSDSGGALLCGVRGVTTICHGRSDAIAIKNALKASNQFVERQLVPKLEGAMARHERLWQDIADSTPAEVNA